MRPLEQVLADEREDAASLRRNGEADKAAIIERICDRVQEAAEDYLRWMTEEQAMTKSGRGQQYFLSRFEEWEALGHARKKGRLREYRSVIVPQRVHASVAYEEGKRAGESAA